MHLSLHMESANPSLSPSQIAVFAGGCFWCLEAVFRPLRGVRSVRSGFAGGHIKNPPYREVCTGRTGHAEAVRVEFDPLMIPYRVLLDVFFISHNPTTLNRQGNDVGTQYRSEIFYSTPDQHSAALSFKEELESQAVYPDPIVTAISPLGEFYEAEAEHDNYYGRNSDQPYCRVIIAPKVVALKQSFAPWLEPTEEI